jgi:hemolysin III
MIYLLIAGTYTPFCLVALPAGVGAPLLAFVVAMAMVGVGLKVFAFERTGLWSYSLYPAMGWTMFLVGPDLIQSLSGTQLTLIIGGGLAYSIGIPVLVAKRPDPLPTVFGYHEIWHALTIAAAGAHFVAIRGVVA